MLVFVSMFILLIMFIDIMMLMLSLMFIESHTRVGVYVCFSLFFTYALTIMLSFMFMSSACVIVLGY